MDRLREVWASLESRLHVQLPGLPEKPPARRGCWSAPAGSAFNIAISKQERGSCLIPPQKDAAQKCGGPSAAQKINESTPDV